MTDDRSFPSAARHRSSVRANPRQVPDRGLGDRAGARPDEEEEGLPRPALGGLGAEETGALSSGEVGLGGAEDQSVGLAANLAGVRGVGSAEGGGGQGS